MFTYNGTPCGAHPDDIVPPTFGGDGVKKVWQDLGMTAEERLVAIAEFETYQARQWRANDYPPIADFADAWVKQDEAALEAYRQACLAVKDKYPKGTA